MLRPRRADTQKANYSAYEQCLKNPKTSLSNRIQKHFRRIIYMTEKKASLKKTRQFNNGRYLHLTHSKRERKKKNPGYF